MKANRRKVGHARAALYHQISDFWVCRHLPKVRPDPRYRLEALASHKKVTWSWAIFLITLVCGADKLSAPRLEQRSHDSSRSHVRSIERTNPLSEKCFVRAMQKAPAKALHPITHPITLPVAPFAPICVDLPRFASKG